MKPRITVLTLGVDNLERAVDFYSNGLGFPTEGIVGREFEHGAVAFFNLTGGLRLAVWARADLAHDIGQPPGPRNSAAFSIGHNVGSAQDVDAVVQQAERAGATIVKPPQKTFYGGYAGYFTDPDGHLWEVVFNPAASVADRRRARYTPDARPHRQRLADGPHGARMTGTDLVPECAHLAARPGTHTGVAMLIDDPMTRRSALALIGLASTAARLSAGAGPARTRAHPRRLQQPRLAADDGADSRHARADRPLHGRRRDGAADRGCAGLGRLAAARSRNYDAIIQTCNDLGGGPPWPQAVRDDFEAYVRNGGGVYVWHGGNNAFPDWPAYNEMIGLGWRKKDFGWAIAVARGRHPHAAFLPAKGSTRATARASTPSSTASAITRSTPACRARGSRRTSRSTTTRVGRRERLDRAVVRLRSEDRDALAAGVDHDLRQGPGLHVDVRSRLEGRHAADPDALRGPADRRRARAAVAGRARRDLGPSHRTSRPPIGCRSDRRSRWPARTRLARDRRVDETRCRRSW